jgi:preprotein translocase subunit SecG
MDTFSTILVVLIVISAAIQFIYMISPRKMKQYLEYLDYDDRVEVVGGKKLSPPYCQNSTLMASIFTFLTIVFGFQAHFYTSDKKFYETLETQEQRQFRHRQVWAYQSYEYQSLIIAAIWYGIKILMSTHRSKTEVL